MILTWFLLGIILILLIARYNESNKLFWTLLFSFMVGYAGTTMIVKTFGDENKKDVKLTQVCSTQMPTTTFNMLSYYMTANMLPESVAVTEQTFVGKNMPAMCESNIASSWVSRRTRDQPLIVKFFDTS